MPNHPEDAAASTDAAAASLDAADPTLLERMCTVMSEARARAWIIAGRVRVDGEMARDEHRPTPHDQRWLITGT